VRHECKPAPIIGTGTDCKIVLCLCVDLRETVDYKKVMQQYNLGPNGGIVTALNLFATIFDQVTMRLVFCLKIIHFEFYNNEN